MLISVTLSVPEKVSKNYCSVCVCVHVHTWMYVWAIQCTVNIFISSHPWSQWELEMKPALHSFGALTIVNVLCHLFSGLNRIDPTCSSRTFPLSDQEVESVSFSLKFGCLDKCNAVEVTLGSFRSLILKNTTVLLGSVCLGMLTLRTPNPGSPGHMRGHHHTRHDWASLRWFSARSLSCPRWHQMEQRQVIPAKLCLNF